MGQTVSFLNPEMKNPITPLDIRVQHSFTSNLLLEVSYYRKPRGASASFRDAAQCDTAAFLSTSPTPDATIGRYLDRNSREPLCRTAARHKPER